MRENIIFKTISKYWIRYLLVLITTIVWCYLQTLSPKILGSIIDLLRSENLNEIYRNIVYLLIISVITLIIYWISEVCTFLNNRSIERDLKNKTLAHLQKLSFDFYKNKNTGDLLIYFTSDISQSIRRVCGMFIPKTIRLIFISIFAVYFMFYSVNLKLTILALVPILIIIICVIYLKKKINNTFKIAQGHYSKLSDNVQENTTAIRLIKSYSIEKEEIKNFSILNENMKKVNMKLIRLDTVLNLIINICIACSFTIAVIYGSTLVKNNVISIGSLLAFNTYIAMLISRIKDIGRIINDYEKFKVSSKRLTEFFDLKPDVINNENTDFSLKNINGNIEIKNLNFNYPDTTELALENITIDIKKGEKIGIIGRVGSGKTTLANLLVRLYNVKNGEILIDGKDINKYPIEVLRNNIGYVFQDNFLFSATIRDNITLFNNIYSEEEITIAMKQSYMYEKIMELPDRLETMINERGNNLSGGEKQRICIARCLIKKPNILLLDDTLSALDTKSQSILIDNIDEIMKNKTAIIISHRVSAIKNLDKIIVIDNGKIVEFGNHNELMKNKGAYFSFYNDQNEEENDKIEEENNENK